MNTIAINNKALDNFFDFLSHLDIKSKKRLITKLTKSIEEGKNNNKTVMSLFGSWVDERDSDAIIKEIIDSRTVNKSIDF